MATKTFGGQDVEVRDGLVPRLVKTGTPIFVYSDEACTMRLLYLTLADDSVVSKLLVSADSKVPIFRLDDMETVYLRILGKVTQIHAQEEGDSDTPPSFPVTVGTPPDDNPPNGLYIVTGN